MLLVRVALVLILANLLIVPVRFCLYKKKKKNLFQCCIIWAWSCVGATWDVRDLWIFLVTHPWSRGIILIRRNDLLICPLITLTSLIFSLNKFSYLKHLKVIQVELKSTSNHFLIEVSTKEIYIWAAKWRGRCLGDT